MTGRDDEKDSERTWISRVGLRPDCTPSLESGGGSRVCRLRHDLGGGGDAADKSDRDRMVEELRKSLDARGLRQDGTSE